LCLIADLRAGGRCLSDCRFKGGRARDGWVIADLSAGGRAMVE
jgi:hypothetical protein